MGERVSACAKVVEVLLKNVVNREIRIIFRIGILGL